MINMDFHLENFAVGDIVFIRAHGALFRNVSAATWSWTNHVGVIVGDDGEDFQVAESRVPFSCTTSLKKFIGRSENGRYEVRRLPCSLLPEAQMAIRREAKRRMGILYHQGFKLHSRRQFCSKFVYEIYRDALGISVGKIETFSDLLARHPHTNQKFWRFWFLGRIPWSRETITPTSIYYCPQLITVAPGPDAHNLSAKEETTRRVLS